MNFSKGAPWLAIGTVLFIGCNENKDATATLPPPPVIVAAVEPRNVPIIDEWIGRLDGSDNVDVRAKVQGYVQEIAYNEGTVVNEGDVLLRLDARPYEAELAQAQAKLAEAQANQEKTDQEEQRQTDLFNKKVTSDRDYRNAVQANSAAKATVDASHAAVDQAQLNLEYATIKSPIKGIVGRRVFTVGNFVPAGSGGTEITKISTVDPIELRFGFSERQYLEWAEDISVLLAKPLEQRDEDFELIRADGKVHPHKGRLFAADRAVDPNTGTIWITAIFPNPGNILRPGQFARVRLKVDERIGALAVAQRAVVEMQGKNFVWIVDDANKAAMRSVSVGPRIGSDWIIDSGLKQGDRVVVEGLQMLTEGGSVQPTTTLANANPAPGNE
ncbi:MAG: efflux RND transporter periplasmic adaptor subunit [Verrucomicrobia bacterium]|nr:efflux RND transporter periplasmic adaptor subunit [Verrucomicrobiota bacterium]